MGHSFKRFMTLAAAFGASTALLAACGDDTTASASGCDEATKPPAAISCTCSYGSWTGCVYPKCSDEKKAECAASGLTCLGDMCVCGNAPCGDDETCLDGTCVETACVGVHCDEEGTSCHGGACVETACVGVSCTEEGTACHGGECVPVVMCGGVECKATETCVESACVETACIGVECTVPGTACYHGGCVEEACVGINCSVGSVCIAGDCVETACINISCPDPTTACHGGECVDARCWGVQCEAGMDCDSSGAAVECVYPACREKACAEGKRCDIDGKCNSAGTGTIIYTLADGNDEVPDDGTKAVWITLKLDDEPGEDVKLSLSLEGDAKDDVVLSVGEAVLTSSNWEGGVEVSVNAREDDPRTLDGDKAFSVKVTTSSDDKGFDGISQSIELVSKDTEKAELTLNLPDLRETSEDDENNGGEGFAFTAKLAARPVSNVAINLSVSDETLATVSPSQLLFTSEDWDKPHQVTVKGKDDGNVVNATPHTYQVLFSDAQTLDAGFKGMKTAPIDLTNADNDAAAILASTSAFTIVEGSEGTISVSLATAPSATVTVTATVNPNHAKHCGVYSSPTLAFSASDYDAPKTITLVALDDDVADGDHPCELKLSSDSSGDSDYRSLSRTIPGTIKDNDKAGITAELYGNDTITEPAPYVSNGLLTSTTIRYRLSSRPTKSVDVQLSSINNEGLSNSDNGATLGKTVLTFTPDNFSDWQYVTVTAADDGVVDGTAKVDIIHKATSADITYTGHIGSTRINVKDVNKKELNFAPGLSLSLSEDWASMPDSLCLTLGTKPTKDVEVKAYSYDEDRLNVTPAALTFTPANWHEEQCFKVNAVNNDVADGDVTATLRVSAGASLGYSAWKDFKFSIKDNDKPGLYLSCTGTSSKAAVCKEDYGYNQSGSVGSVKCAVRLTTKPKQKVTISVKPSDMSLFCTDSSCSSKMDTYYGIRLNFDGTNYNKDQYATFYYDAVSYQAKRAVGTFTVSAATQPADIYDSYYIVSAQDYQTFTRRYTCDYYYFPYEGKYASVYLPKGKYVLHAWGASGGKATDANMKLDSYGDFECGNVGGMGAYAKGTLTLNASETIYVRAGQAGRTGDTGMDSYNGGGKGRGGGSDRRGAAGGGATDFCIGSGCTSDSGHMPYRILVAGGGGGGPAATDDCWGTSGSDNSHGGNAGASYSSTARSGGAGTHSGEAYAYGGTTDGKYGGSTTLTARFGYGQGIGTSDCDPDSDAFRHGGGGGGWYGGLAYCGNTKTAGGGGGSSYAFTGTREYGGQQDYGFALKDTALKPGRSTSASIPEYAPHATAAHVLTQPTLANTYRHLGDGYALIEVKEDIIQ